MSEREKRAVGVAVGAGLVALVILWRQAQAAQYGRFIGTVIDANTEAPIVDRIVYIDDYPSVRPTDESGSFVVSVPPGTYYTLSVGGYEPVAI